MATSSKTPSTIKPIFRLSKRHREELRRSISDEYWWAKRYSLNKPIYKKAMAQFFKAMLLDRE